jgi:hypothetical protein
MKNIIIITIISAALAFSCASIMASVTGMSQEDKAYKIVPQNIGENRAVARFYSFEFLKAKEDKRAEIEMREPNYNRIPKSGYISIRIQGATSSASNPKYWLFIVQDKNKNEIHRGHGPDSRPLLNVYNDTKNYYTSYINYHRISVPNDTEFPLYLRVVNILDKQIDIIIVKR